MGMQSQRTIIIAGGNFAGLTLARNLDRRHYHVTVLDPGQDFEWYPNTHELISRQKKAAHLRHSRQRILERLGHRFQQSAVTVIDRAQQRITTSDGQSLPYDELVLAIGNVSSIDRIPGAREHAIACSHIAGAERAAQQLQRLDALNLPSRPVVLIGANFVGLEVLGEILRRYRRQWRFQLTVVDSQGVMLPTYRGLDAWLREQCHGLDIEWRMGEKVTGITRDKVELESGASLDSRLTLWCGGNMPHPLPAAAGLGGAGQHAPVLSTLQSTQDPHIWIPGDASAFPTPLDKQAFHAMGMATRIAGNLDRLRAGRQPEAYRPLPLPRILSFGENAVMLLRSHALAHPALLAAKESVYQANFSRFCLPRHTREWLDLKDSLTDSALGMARLARHSWSERTLLQARRFEVD